MLSLDVFLARVSPGRCVHDVQLLVVLGDQGWDRVEETEGVLFRVLEGDDVAGPDVGVAGVALVVVRRPVGCGP